MKNKIHQRLLKYTGNNDDQIELFSGGGIITNQLNVGDRVIENIKHVFNQVTGLFDEDSKTYNVMPKNLYLKNVEDGVIEHIRTDTNE